MASSPGFHTLSRPASYTRLCVASQSHAEELQIIYRLTTSTLLAAAIALAVYDSTIPFGSAPRGPRRKASAEVGAISPANAFGLHDMHGNVWEWVADFWHLDYTGAPTNGGVWDAPEMIPVDADDPAGEQMEDESRVARGGAWNTAASHYRSASRFRLAPPTASPYLGFRVVTR